MINDPVVEEVRQAREKVLAEAGGDIKSLMDYLRRMELQHPERIVTLEEVRRRREERKRRDAKQSRPANNGIEPD